MNGARDEFDVDPEEWRQQFWGNDADSVERRCGCFLADDGF